VAKEKVPKERPPYVLAFGVSVRFSLERALRNSLSLRQSSLFSALSLQCSTTQKGLEDQNKGQNLVGGTS